MNNQDNKRYAKVLDDARQAATNMAHAFGLGGKRQDGQADVEAENIATVSAKAPPPMPLPGPVPEMGTQSIPPRYDVTADESNPSSPPALPVMMPSDASIPRDAKRSAGSMDKVLLSEIQAIRQAQDACGRQLDRIESSCKSTLDQGQAQVMKLTGMVRALENQSLQEAILKPLLHDLIMLNDSLADLQAILSSNTDTVPESAVQLCEALMAALEDILERQGVTRTSRETPALDLRRQKVIKVERIPACKAGEIVGIRELRGGYEWHGQVLRIQEVLVTKVE